MSESVRDEFLAEAQEIIESLSRDLLLLDQAQKDTDGDPDLVNEVFRSVHTLKGIAGMFGYAQLGALAHALEDLLDDLRLGRVALTQEVLDVLFEGVENFQRLLSEDEASIAVVSLEGFAASIERVSGKGRAPAHDPLSDYDIDPGVLSVLTEYEEHRLRTNLQQGLNLFRFHVRFSLTSIDTLLEDLKRRAKPVAEIITYLPSMDGGDGDHIELDVLLASSMSSAQLSEVLDAQDDSLRMVPRLRGRASSQAQSSPLTPAPPARIPNPPVPRELEGLTGLHEDPSVDRDVSADQLSLRSVANTVRVDIRKLDHLMNVVGELAIVRSTVARLSERIRLNPQLRHLAIELHRVNRGFERHLDDLQEGILDVRMVPLGQVFDKLARIVRQVAREHEKEIRLVVTGAETEVDKLIVEELSDPLMHIIRNAIDHGIESPKSRELAGKSPTGTLALNAFQQGNHVLIEIEDDGAGMDEAKLIEAAVRKGLIPREAVGEVSREEALNFIFAPGFSTASSVTDTSGRGVGMDVVKTNISRLGGVIDVQSEPGTGTKFTFMLPVTLAIISALLVRVRDRWYALPITSVHEAILLDEKSVRTVEGREVLTLRGSTLPICRLERLFDLAHLPRQEHSRQYVVVSALGQRRLGFVVDALAGQQDIVIKALGPSLRDTRGFSGATDLGDQRVALVLDAPGLVEEVLSGSEGVRMRVRS